MNQQAAERILKLDPIHEKHLLEDTAVRMAMKVVHCGSHRIPGIRALLAKHPCFHISGYRWVVGKPYREIDHWRHGQHNEPDDQQLLPTAPGVNCACAQVRSFAVCGFEKHVAYPFERWSHPLSSGLPQVER